MQLSFITAPQNSAQFSLFEQSQNVPHWLVSATLAAIRFQQLTAILRAELSNGALNWAFWNVIVTETKAGYLRPLQPAKTIPRILQNPEGYYDTCGIHILHIPTEIKHAATIAGDNDKAFEKVLLQILDDNPNAEMIQLFIDSEY